MERVVHRSLPPSPIPPAAILATNALGSNLLVCCLRNQVRVAGLKLLLGVVASGASPSAAAAKTSPAPSRDPHEHPPAIIYDVGASGSDRGITESGGGVDPGCGNDDRVGSDGRVGGDGGVGAGVNGATSGGIPSGTESAISLSGSGERGTAGIREGKAAMMMMPDRLSDKRTTLATTAAAASTGRSVLSPAVMSRAKRLLIGLSNIDESAEVRKLASQALVALGGPATS